MIDNSDTIGHFRVTIIAKRNQVAGFQCPTMEDVRLEAARITAERIAQGLPVGKVNVRQIIGKSPIRFSAPVSLQS